MSPEPRHSLLFFFFLLFALVVPLALGGNAPAPRLPAPIVLELEERLPQHVKKNIRQGSFYDNLTVPLAYNIVEFYATISVGTPPQHFTVQIDTGSALFAIPAAGCQGCSGHPSDRFVKGQSSTVANLSCSDLYQCTGMRCYGDTLECSFFSKYQDSSHITGILLKDRITFGDLAFDAMFGAIYEAAGTFSYIPQVDGILGLSYFSDLACFPNCVPPLWDTLLSSIGIPDLFTLDFDFTKGKPQMVMGGTGRVQTSDITWTPIIEESYYVVDLKEIDVGGIPIQFDSSDLGQTIVDSGTTLLLLPQKIYSALKAGFLSVDCSAIGICQHAIGNSIFDSCFSYEDIARQTDNLALYPNISFKFPGVQVDLTPWEYLRLDIPGLCVSLGIESIDSPLTVLGDTFMRNRATVFDRANKRVGFTNASPYTWARPPMSEWARWNFIFSVSGLTCFCVITLGCFIYVLRRRSPYSLERLGRYIPLIPEDSVRDFGDEFAFALPTVSSSSQLLRAGGAGSSFEKGSVSPSASSSTLINPDGTITSSDTEEALLS